MFQFFPYKEIFSCYCPANFVIVPQILLLSRKIPIRRFFSCYCPVYFNRFRENSDNSRNHNKNVIKNCSWQYWKIIEILFGGSAPSKDFNNFQYCPSQFLITYKMSTLFHPTTPIVFERTSLKTSSLPKLQQLLKLEASITASNEWGTWNFSWMRSLRGFQ